MTTRELIEAVREPKSGLSRSWGGALVDSVYRTDYDALRAACVAVLDECIADCKVCAGCGRIPTWEPDIESAWKHMDCACCANARALREKLR